MKEIIKTAETILKNHPKEYQKCLDELRKTKDSFKFLTKETHLIASATENYSVLQLKFIIEQYSVFSRKAIHMLVDAMLRNYDWPLLAKELQENINEEKGSETKNIPHLEMMRRGYQKDLGILTDEVVACGVTYSFITKMNSIFNNNDNAYSAGALLAFEGTAIQEFHIIDSIIKAYDKKTGNNKVQEKGKLTNLYIDGHKDFEIGHEAHLAESIRPYITPENVLKMVQGYLDVSVTMNAWWSQLEMESWCREARRMFVPIVEEFPIETAFPEIK